MGKVHHSEEEFLAQFEAHSDAIFRYCFFKVSDYDQAHDITQETFTKVWQEILNGKKIQNHKAFLYRIATNMIIDFYRKKKSQSLDTLEESGFTPVDEQNETNIEDRAEVRVMKDAVQKLDEKYRDVIILRYIEELSPREIAKILDLTENVVSVRIHRGLKQLQKRMED